MLLLAYALTMAPDVTFWDAGEFVAAAVTFGIPHPPGTPLYVLLAHSALALAPGANPAAVLSALSAACTAVACGVGASLVARWTRDGAAGVAAGVCAGAASTVWLNATEPEVYSVTLLLGAAALWLGDRIGREGSNDGRVTSVAAYTLALAAPLHLSALVVAPGVAGLAYGEGGARRRGLALLLVAVSVATAGAATASPLLLALGSAGALALGALRMVRWREAGGALLALAVALSAVAVLVVRARHDPAVNQGNPSTLTALVEVVGRRQYEQVGMWPRNAPPWLQVANLLQYADWQFGLLLGAGPAFAPARTAVAALFLALGAVGAGAHRRASPASWRAMVVLAAAASFGVVAYLNFRAGPSIGWGIIPDDALHEARERDYFFAPAFWCWGLWAGVGAVTVAAGAVRLGRRGRAALAVGLVALPLALNGPAINRRREPDARLPAVLAAALLDAAPANAVLVAAGDNDSYPLWYAQQARGHRQDVTVVTAPLLPAGWYRAEQARRWGLLAGTDTLTGGWRGYGPVLGAIARRARAAGRPVAATAMIERDRLAALGAGAGGRWRFDGLLYVAEPAVGGDAGTVRRDTAAARRHAAALAPLLEPAPGVHADPAVRYMATVLGCPAAVVRVERREAVDTLLASRCGLR